MEKLQTKLFEAATQGSISSLQQLLKDDPLILDRVAVNSFNETPLHVAAMLGHIDFVKKIIGIKPHLVNELNLEQSSPLHLASAKGHIEVMKALLSVDHEACFVRDRNALTPVHLAATKGRVEAVKMLLQAQPDAARLTVYGGENILHLCVKHYQLEVLKLLFESSVRENPEFINSKDVDGNTVLHLAVADKQVEATIFLVSVDAVNVNAVNNDGMTAVDVLIRSRKDMRDSEIEKVLKHGGGFGSSDTNYKMAEVNRNQKKKSWNGQHRDWLEKQKTALMIVATLIATMAFQIGVNPPGGVWQDDVPASSSTDPHRAGFSILQHRNPVGFGRFYIANTTSFIASLSIILLLVSGLPLRKKVFMWILMVTTWIAITAIALCYIFAIAVLTPNYNHANTVLVVVGFTVIVWILLMALLIIAHTIRLIVMLVKKLRKKSFAVSALQRNNMAV